MTNADQSWSLEEATIVCSYLSNNTGELGKQFQSEKLRFLSDLLGRTPGAIYQFYRNNANASGTFQPKKKGRVLGTRLPLKESAKQLEDLVARYPHNHEEAFRIHAQNMNKSISAVRKEYYSNRDKFTNTITIVMSSKGYVIKKKNTSNDYFIPFTEENIQEKLRQITNLLTNE